MSNHQIHGAFYPLTPGVSKKLRESNLTAAEWRIWSYLIEIDPWGDRYEDFDTLALLEACNVSKATFYRAIAKFQELEIFDFQDKGFSIRNTYGVSSLKNEKTVSDLRQDSQTCENQSSEPLPDSSSGVTQTIQTYSDFIQTLSEEERANFLNFCQEKTKNLSQEVNDIEAWLAHTNKAGKNRWEVYYQKFLTWQQAQSKKSQPSRGSQMMKKFQEELEQQRQQAVEMSLKQV